MALPDHLLPVLRPYERARLTKLRVGMVAALHLRIEALNGVKLQLKRKRLRQTYSGQDKRHVRHSSSIRGKLMNLDCIVLYIARRSTRDVRCTCSRGVLMSSIDTKDTRIWMTSRLSRFPRVGTEDSVDTHVVRRLSRFRPVVLLGELHFSGPQIDQIDLKSTSYDEIQPQMMRLSLKSPSNRTLFLQVM